MFVKDIYIYTTIDAWLREEPDTVIKGSVNSKGNNWIEIIDENDLHQIINIEKLFAIVY